MTFSVFISPQADIVAQLLQEFFPNGCKSIDVTFGSGGLWWKVKESPIFAPIYPVTACDAAPDPRLKSRHEISAYNLLTDDYTALGLHDAMFFDPPYLIGRNNFDIPLVTSKKTGSHKAIQGQRSWIRDELNKYTNNATAGDFNRRVEALLRVAPQCLKRGGLLFVKIMDVRVDGRIIPHHINIANILSKSFDIVDTGIYVRQGATTWRVKRGLQNLHGYWMVFQLRKEDSL